MGLFSRKKKTPDPFRMVIVDGRYFPISALGACPCEHVMKDGHCYTGTICYAGGPRGPRGAVPLSGPMIPAGGAPWAHDAMHPETWPNSEGLPDPAYQAEFERILTAQERGVPYVPGAGFGPRQGNDGILRHGPGLAEGMRRGWDRLRGPVGSGRDLFEHPDQRAAAHERLRTAREVGAQRTGNESELRRMEEEEGVYDMREQWEDRQDTMPPEPPGPWGVFGQLGRGRPVTVRRMPHGI
ncbi:hypothetical protein NA57DRAFT_81986 [Rhizodiscina lignyota]|uniref:Uncharacterized protein n=1 Tax=Rhizodiscina lignyota TaxID=1504668 RepID=A0A9P4I3J1_9PEZI|nr:hypothetical protein NA57DRAFT_81986 [Rhizodiscina lignyota]